MKYELHDAARDAVVCTALQQKPNNQRKATALSALTGIITTVLGIAFLLAAPVMFFRTRKRLSYPHAVLITLAYLAIGILFLVFL